LLRFGHIVILCSACEHFLGVSTMRILICFDSSLDCKIFVSKESHLVSLMLLLLPNGTMNGCGHVECHRMPLSQLDRGRQSVHTYQVLHSAQLQGLALKGSQADKWLLAKGCLVQDSPGSSVTQTGSDWYMSRMYGTSVASAKQNTLQCTAGYNRK
jgi:hypothetical protein